MPESKIFLSYSQRKKNYREEVRRVLETVPSIKQALWFDEKNIGISDKFDPAIRQAMEKSWIGILLLSTDFFSSDYITQHELPYLLRRAEQGSLKLACLYVTAIPEGAFQHSIDIDGQPRTVNIKEYIGANSPSKPLDALWRRSQRQQVYVALANWVSQQLADKPAPAPLGTLPVIASNAPRRPGERFELAIALDYRGGHWQGRFSLPRNPHFQQLPHAEPAPTRLFSDPAMVNGDQLFDLLFGTDRASSGQILGATFDLPMADPTRHSLRVHLLTDDDRLASLPWNRLSFQDRRLVDNGWMVELHPNHANGFPEYPLHTCYFPGKVVLIQTSDGQPTPQAIAHGHDLQSFFQRHWQEAPPPLLVHTAADLHEVLRAGATRLVYIYGPASSAGLPLADTVMPWSTLAELLQRSQSVSVVLLNLLGDAALEAIPATRALLQGAMAVLVLWHGRTTAPAAPRAGLAWLSSVFVDSERLDPVEALYQHARQQAVAWTRYANWQTVAPIRISMPELVNLLLDRRTQRAELAQAKSDFYTFQTRRIYQAVAFGLRGARVNDFPDMVSQHLRNDRRPQEVFRIRTVPLRGRLSHHEDIDDLVRQQYNLAPRQPVLQALLDGSPISGTDFWFVIIGWRFASPLADAQRGAEIIQAIATWCRMHLLPDMRQEAQYANVRVLSVVAMEVASEDMVEALEDRMAILIEDLNDDASFHLGQLGALGKVERQDLRNYFQDPQICSCPDPYRREFPGLLLAGRRDMPFDQAVAAIQRGEPDNWGNFYEELQELTACGEWPPDDEDNTFWESRDGR